MKTLYLVVRSLDPKGTGQTRWAVRWKPALNAFRHHLLRPHARGREQPKRTASAQKMTRGGAGA